MARRRASSASSKADPASTQSLTAIQLMERLLSIIVILLERLVTGVTHILPQSVIEFFTSAVRWLFSWSKSDNSAYNRLVSQANPEYSKDVLIRRVESLRTAKDFEQLCALNGFECENHLVRTEDNFLLTVHRINPTANGFKANGKAVFLQHGLLMNSEIWCVRINKQENLPFVLCELGYDVFLGNNRGNKYSCKHRDTNVKERAFWDFSIDEFALYDMPACIDYVLALDGLASLTYIGFSQGCSQILAGLSVNKELNNKIDKLVLIAPATTPKRLSNWLINSIVHLQPKMLFLLFGRTILMKSILFYLKIVYPPFMIHLIDLPNKLLFDWHGRNIDIMQKLAAYFHLYSTTSVKSVVHWFQIIRRNRFQMYQDSDSFQPLEYPIHTASVRRVLLLYGKADSLVDIDQMLDQLPDFDSVTITDEPCMGKAGSESKWVENTANSSDSSLSADHKVNEMVPPTSLRIVGVEGYEHLDLIWGKNVKNAVIRNVLAFLA